MQKELMEMLYQLGCNSQKQKSLAASDVVDAGSKKDQDKLCVNTISKILKASDEYIKSKETQGQTPTRSFAAADISDSEGLNKPKVLLNFVMNNGRI